MCQSPAAREFLELFEYRNCFPGIALRMLLVVARGRRASSGVGLRVT